MLEKKRKKRNMFKKTGVMDSLTRGINLSHFYSKIKKAQLTLGHFGDDHLLDIATTYQITLTYGIRKIA